MNTRFPLGASFALLSTAMVLPAASPALLATQPVSASAAIAAAANGANESGHDNSDMRDPGSGFKPSGCGGEVDGALE